MRFIDFSSWQGVLSTLAGLALFTLFGMGIRVLMMLTIQQKQQRMNRQINERLKTLISAYKVLGGSFTGRLSVDPSHLGARKRAGAVPTELTGPEAGAVLVAALVSGGYSAEGAETGSPHPSEAVAADQDGAEKPSVTGAPQPETSTAAGGLTPDPRAPEADMATPEGPPSHILERRAQIRDAVEAALADILLLGTEEQVRLAGKAAADLAEGRVIQTAELVVALRDYIRKSLDLEPIPKGLTIPAQGPTRPSSGPRGAGRAGAGGPGGGGGGGLGGGMGMGMGVGMGMGRRSDQTES